MIRFSFVILIPLIAGCQLYPVNPGSDDGGLALAYDLANPEATIDSGLGFDAIPPDVSLADSGVDVELDGGIDDLDSGRLFDASPLDSGLVDCDTHDHGSDHGHGHTSHGNGKGVGHRDCD